MFYLSTFCTFLFCFLLFLRLYAAAATTTVLLSGARATLRELSCAKNRSQLEIRVSRPSPGIPPPPPPSPFFIPVIIFITSHKSGFYASSPRTWIMHARTHTRARLYKYICVYVLSNRFGLRRCCCRCCKKREIVVYVIRCYLHTEKSEKRRFAVVPKEYITSWRRREPCAEYSSRLRARVCERTDRTASSPKHSETLARVSGARTR